MIGGGASLAVGEGTYNLVAHRTSSVRSIPGGKWEKQAWFYIKLGPTGVVILLTTWDESPSIL